MNGIHHITAIAGDARRNLDFYAGTLGLRLVKRTVNFDDPGTYHLYFGDEAGSPGTIVTFFPWANSAPGRAGAGEMDETSLRIPLAAMDYWAARLGAERTENFGEPTLSFRDPDGMKLALVGIDGIEAEPAWTGGGIPAEHAIRGIHGVRLSLDGIAPTASVLTDLFGFVADEVDGNCSRFRVPGRDIGGIVDLHDAPAAAPATLGRGSVHHLAFRATDDAEQADMAARLARDHGLRATEQKDRDYFRSIYFRSPGGVLFEIATEAPGFAVDEPAATLGSALKLPAFLRARQGAIEAALLPLD